MDAFRVSFHFQKYFVFHEKLQPVEPSHRWAPRRQKRRRLPPQAGQAAIDDGVARRLLFGEIVYINRYRCTPTLFTATPHPRFGSVSSTTLAAKRKEAVMKGQGSLFAL